MNFDTPAWTDHFAEFEGNLPHFYLDGAGIVTIGIGCVVYAPTELPMLYQANGQKAVAADIQSEYYAVKAMAKGLRASEYGKVCRLFLAQPDIDQFFLARLADILGQISHVINLENYQESAALAFTDMAFNLGVSGLQAKFPKFMNAFRVKDWEVCARECERNGIQKERNDWTRGTFEALAKGSETL